MNLPILIYSYEVRIQSDPPRQWEEVEITTTWYNLTHHEAIARAVGLTEVLRREVRINRIDSPQGYYIGPNLTR